MSLFQEIIWAFNNGRVGIIVGFSIIGFATLSLALFFFLMRESIVWYFRIHELIALQRKTNELLEVLLAERTRGAMPDPKKMPPSGDRRAPIVSPDAPHLKVFEKLEKADAGKIIPMDV